MKTIKEINTGQSHLDLERIPFFDHIRYLMVLLVVVLHAACGYSNFMPHWAVNDNNSMLFDRVLLILDVFLMPILFFIAGYFALPSLITKGVFKFLKAKLFRLGIPLLLGLLFFRPIQDIIFYYSREIGSYSLWDHFTANIHRALTFYTGLITTTRQFHHGYFWFISLLLFFFIVFGFVYRVKPFGFKEPSSNKSMLWILFGVVMAITLFTFVPGMLFFQGIRPNSWLLVANVLMFQPTKIVLYVWCFGTGIYACSRQWFSMVKVPGHFMLWTGISILLFAFFLMTLKRLNLNGPNGIDIFLIIFLRNALVFSILLAFISFSTRYWNNASKLNTLFSKTSYHTYLLHMGFVLVLQLGLYKWFPDSSVFIKFGIVSVGAIVLSVLTARYMTGPYPKFCVAGIVGVFFLLMVF